MKELKIIGLGLIAIVLVAGFIYGSYWIAKNGSYWLWYEDMVKETIREMVKPEYLRTAP